MLLWQQQLYYILNEDGSVRACDDVLEWGANFEKANRRVAYSVFGNKAVSTVFLGVDHNYLHNGPPLLFETMVFDKEKDDWNECVRYSTWQQAVEGHERIVSSLDCGFTKEQLEAAKAVIEPLLEDDLPEG